MNCDWAQTLTRYECRQVSTLHGGVALEIGTPFSLHDGSAINLYIVEHGSHVLITDNGDTLSQLSGTGLDVWQSGRLKVIRERASLHGLTLDRAGDLRCLAAPSDAQFVFARAVSGILSVADWAGQELRQSPSERDVAAEAEPYIRARHPDWQFEYRKTVLGASHTEYRFAFRHGPELIDVVAPSAQATGALMRKFGDVQNGPYADGLTPLAIVDDRFDADRAHQEIRIIGSIGRAMSFSDLMLPSALH